MLCNNHMSSELHPSIVSVCNSYLSALNLLFVDEDIKVRFEDNTFTFLISLPDRLYLELSFKGLMWEGVLFLPKQDPSQSREKKVCYHIDMICVMQNLGLTIPYDREIAMREELKVTLSALT